LRSKDDTTVVGARWDRGSEPIPTYDFGFSIKGGSQSQIANRKSKID
jgi:hypothetical protein